MIAPRSLLLAASACVLLCACGQKGPLYLPDEATPVLVAPAPATPAAPGQNSEAQPPAGASQDTRPQDARTRSSR
jgi:predicted small lipoprotein YifL